jgi:hypothetical protein
MNYSAMQDHLELDYLLNRATDSYRFRELFRIDSNDDSNVSITSYARCQASVCDYPEHFVHLATSDITLEDTKAITSTSLDRASETRMSETRMTDGESRTKDELIQWLADHYHPEWEP